MVWPSTSCPGLGRASDHVLERLAVAIARLDFADNGPVSQEVDRQLSLLRFAAPLSPASQQSWTWTEDTPGASDASFSPDRMSSSTGRYRNWSWSTQASDARSSQALQTGFYGTQTVSHPPVRTRNTSWQTHSSKNSGYRCTVPRLESFCGQETTAIERRTCDQETLESVEAELGDLILGSMVKSVPPPSYVCHSCYEPGHFIRDCPLALDREFSGKKLTPYQGPKPCHGFFSCSRCHHKWECKFKSYANEGQECFKCKIEVFPYKQVRCPLCHHKWECKFKSYANEGQDCFKCKIEVFPYKQEPVKDEDGAIIDAPVTIDLNQPLRTETPSPTPSASTWPSSVPGARAITKSR